MRIILIFFLFCLTCFDAFTQGCSDAGFCTMGAMKPDQVYNKRTKVRLRSLELSQYLGLTRFNDKIVATSADFTVAFGDNYNAQVKLPYSFTFGPLANTSGIGDISLSLSRNVIQTHFFSINATVGTKIPTGQPNNTTEEGRPLPMYYQQTLGTYDLILGLSFISDKWLIATGYQMPLNEVDNEFVWGKWAESEDFEVSREYPVSQDLLRGNDMMLRIERNFRFIKYSFNIGLLNIYRLNQDVVTSPQTGERVKVDGSDGLAMTALGGFRYNLNIQSSFQLIQGIRLIERDRNPDGLSRKSVTTLAYIYSF